MTSHIYITLLGTQVMYPQFYGQIANTFSSMFVPVKDVGRYRVVRKTRGPDQRGHSLTGWRELGIWAGSGCTHPLIFSSSHPSMSHKIGQEVKWLSYG